MEKYDKKLELLKKYYTEIIACPGFQFQLKGEISSKKIDAAEKAFASKFDRESILGFYDTTLFGNGGEGYIFTDTKMYYLETFEKPKKLWYDDIEKTELLNIQEKDCDRTLKIYLCDGLIITITSILLNKKPLQSFLIGMKELMEEKNSNGGNIPFSAENYSGAEAGGIAMGNYGNVNRGYEEEKFHAEQGHGFAAERANNLYDKLTGHDAKILGDDNAKNGADRIVDGVYIQSKYCQTGNACINACFEEGGKGSFRYMIDGKPMQIEVPSDMYEEAVAVMQEKIRNGQIEGVSNPEEAKNIVRKGNFTYAQAKNIAKAGTVESLTYDAVNGVIIASTAFGVTAIITFATSVWNGDDFDVALKNATYVGLKVGGTAFLTSVIVGQLEKAGLNSALVGVSEKIVARMGPEASQVLINAFRSGKPVYGAAAMKSAAKLLRNNAITAGVTFVVLSLSDIRNIFRSRISGKQLFKNMVNTGTSVVSSTGGLLAGAVIGAKVMSGSAGKIVGAIVGSIVAGTLASKASNATLDHFIEDDAEKMVKIIEKVFGEMAGEYLLSQKEAEKSVDKLKDKLDGTLLKDMFASSNREEFIREILTPIIENEVAKRRKITAVSDDIIDKCLREVLEGMVDELEDSGCDE